MQISSPLNSGPVFYFLSGLKKILKNLPVRKVLIPWNWDCSGLAVAQVVEQGPNKYIYGIYIYIYIK